jgi:hypothetical protein
MNLLEEMYGAAEHPPVAVSVDFGCHDRTFVCLFDDRGRLCAVMGVDLARRLGWLEDDK